MKRMKLMKYLVLLGSLLSVVSYAAEPPVKITLTKDNMAVINDVFTPDVTAKVILAARSLDSGVETNEPIYLVINSPGGSIDAGLQLIQVLSNLHRPVHTITLFAASMGFQTVQGLGTRYIVPEGTLMSHKAKGGFFGEFPGQLDSRYGYYLKRVTRMDEKAVSRTKGKHTLKSYRDLIENEWWGDGQDPINQGFADKIAAVSCDRSLEGTRNYVLAEEGFMGHTVQLVALLDNCPLNAEALKYSVIVDGQMLYPAIRSEEDKKKEEALKTKVAGPLWYGSNDPYRAGVYNSDVTTSIINLTKEEMFLINKFTTDKIDAYKNKKSNVIKGY